MERKNWNLAAAVAAALLVAFGWMGTAAAQQTRSHDLSRDPDLISRCVVSCLLPPTAPMDGGADAGWSECDNVAQFTSCHAGQPDPSHNWCAGVDVDSAKRRFCAVCALRRGIIISGCEGLATLPPPPPAYVPPNPFVADAGAAPWAQDAAVDIDAALPPNPFVGDAGADASVDALDAATPDAATVADASSDPDASAHADATGDAQDAHNDASRRNRDAGRDARGHDASTHTDGAVHTDATVVGIFDQDAMLEALSNLTDEQWCNLHHNLWIASTDPVDLLDAGVHHGVCNDPQGQQIIRYVNRIVGDATDAGYLDPSHASANGQLATVGHVQEIVDAAVTTERTAREHAEHQTTAELEGHGRTIRTLGTLSDEHEMWHQNHNLGVSLGFGVSTLRLSQDPESGTPQYAVVIPSYSMPVGDLAQLVLRFGAGYGGPGSDVGQVQFLQQIGLRWRSRETFYYGGGVGVMGLQQVATTDKFMRAGMFGGYGELFAGMHRRGFSPIASLQVAVGAGWRQEHNQAPTWTLEVVPGITIGCLYVW